MYKEELEKYLSCIKLLIRQQENELEKVNFEINQSRVDSIIYSLNKDVRDSIENNIEALKEAKGLFEEKIRFESSRCDSGDYLPFEEEE